MSFGALYNEMTSQLFAPILPELTPARTSIPSTSANFANGGASPTSTLWTTGVVPAVAANSGAGVVPMADTIRRDFASQFGTDINVAMIDTSTQTTTDSLQGQPITPAILAQRYAEGYEREFEVMMPLFNLRGQGVATPNNPHPRSINHKCGGASVATHVLLNQLQGRLHIATQRAGGRGDYVSDAAEHANKQRRGQINKAAAARHPMIGDSANETLNTLRALGATDTQSLFAGIEWLGPISEVQKSGNGGYADPASERFFSYSIAPSCGRIFNVFAARPRINERIYWSVAEYDEDTLESIGVACGFEQRTATAASSKRSRDSFVGGEARGANYLRYPQVRGWSSADTNQIAKSIDKTEWLDVPALDLFYKARERQMLLDYTEYRYDAELDAVVEVVRSYESEQEALDNMPSAMFDEYMSAAAVIPVGTIKSKSTACVSPYAIHLAHYKHEQLRAMPHMEIFQHNGA